MKKYSRVYKLDGKSFRYDFEDCMVEYISKAGKDEIADNAEWMAKYGKPLWDIDESGYIVIERVGLRPENWKSKWPRDEYLSEWIADIEESVAWEMAMDMKFL